MLRGEAFMLFQRDSLFYDSPLNDQGLLERLEVLMKRSDVGFKGPSQRLARGCHVSLSLSLSPPPLPSKLFET